MKKKTEAVTPAPLVRRLLDAAGDNVVLVGGQALAFWADRYAIAPPSGYAAISGDVDFLSKSAVDRDIVRKLARSINGRALFPGARALAALVGQAVLDISEDEFINVDVVHTVIGIAGDTIRKRAVRIAAPDGTAQFLVMHPLDVLHSRLANLHKLAEKQDDKGRMQLALAIEVTREFLRRAAAQSPAADIAAGRSPIQAYVSAIEQMATEDAGRKVAQRHGLHVADAIDPRPIPRGPFWTRRWPTLKELMSAQYSATIHPPGPAGEPD